jgi:hypothetical protein
VLLGSGRVVACGPHGPIGMVLEQVKIALVGRRHWVSNPVSCSRLKWSKWPGGTEPQQALQQAPRRP